MPTKSIVGTKREIEHALRAVKEENEIDPGNLEFRGTDYKRDDNIRLRTVAVVDINSGRWISYHTAVVQVAHEDWGTVPYFVAFDFERPLTEMQERSEGPSDPYLVTPRQVSTTVWDKVKK